MRRSSQRPLADAFLWIGLLLFLFGAADLLPSEQPFRENSSPRVSESYVSGASQSSNPERRLVHGHVNLRHLRSVPSPAIFPTPVNVSELTVCRHTHANPQIIADSRGYLCSHDSRTSSGCCHTDDDTTSRFSCHMCDQHHCCDHFEQCVSCCLHPNYANLRDAVRSHRSFRNYAVHTPFDVCVAVCRSGSSSVIHENAYKHARHHCFGLIPPEFDPALHHGVFDFATPVSTPATRPLSSRAAS